MHNHNALHAALHWSQRRFLRVVGTSVAAVPLFSACSGTPTTPTPGPEAAHSPPSPRWPLTLNTAADTNLLYVSNTTGQIFKRTVDQKTYVLLSGRWYAAPSAAGSVVDASAAGGVEAHGWRVGAERQDPAGQHGRQHATLRRS
jgi:hypothetical protein